MRVPLAAPLSALLFLGAPVFGQVAFAASASPSAGGQSAGRQTLLAESAVLGGGTIQESGGDMSALFRLRAGPTAKAAEGGNLEWASADGTEAYNGAIHSYSVSGNTATISGAGPMFKSDGTRARVRFTLEVTPGGAGQSTLHLTFTGKDVSMDCHDILQTGFVDFGPLNGSAASQLGSIKSTLQTLRQDITQLRGQAQPASSSSPAAAS